MLVSAISKDSKLAGHFEYFIGLLKTPWEFWLIKIIYFGPLNSEIGGKMANIADQLLLLALHISANLTG